MGGDAVTTQAEKQRQCIQQYAAEDMLLSPAVFDVFTAAEVAEHLPKVRTLGPPLHVTPKTLQTLEPDETSTDAANESQSVEPGTPVTEQEATAADTHTRETSVTIESSATTEKKERGVTDFVQYFSNRVEKISNMLMRRRELKGATSISNVREQDEYADVCFTGIVDDKRMVKNDRAVLTVSDMTGTVEVLTPENVGLKVLEDDVIGIQGSVGSDIIYADSITYPDIPLMKEAATTNEEVYAAFLSDIHIGSDNYLPGKMNAFLDWLQSNHPVAEKTKYVFIAGDAVEGIGVYPGQRSELAYEDIYKQYELFEDLIRSMPDDKEIIIGPGNHDIVRLAEPQPPLPTDAVPTLAEKENVHLVANPATVTIHDCDGSTGIRVLMYHGTSFDTHVDALPHLRRNDPYSRPDDALADYLKRRHLAPMYGSAHLAPQEEDHLVIEQVPDIFVTGHLHTFSLSNYRSTNVICAGTFQEQTPFQRRMGHIPDPGKVALVNLQTRQFLYKVF